MAETVRVTRHLESETIHLPEARDFIGCDVAIVVRAIVRTAPSDRSWESLKGSVLRYEDPLEPVAEEDWEALQ